jgi:spore germination cell wall hydrolase CwlJ-like protein
MLIRPKRCLIVIALALLAIKPLPLEQASTLQLQAKPYKATGNFRTRELLCLAKNIYHESRGEPFHGKVAVAQVTMNRLRHPSRFQATICGVVYENKQFSWTDSIVTIRDEIAWQEAKLIAHAVMSGRLAIPNFNALYFHTKQVFPRWRLGKKVVSVIGNHIFYA